MAKILGLDLGTNSIGWSLIEKTDDTSKIIKIGSRIIPMPQDVLGNFDKGVSISQTAERTGFRGVRRIKERHLLRRERLHRVLNILGFLPFHYASEIDFEKRLGKFKDNKEPKLAYNPIENPNTPKLRKIDFEFIFKNSFNEMVEEFKNTQPQIFEGSKLIPYDWTIYYLRKKALTTKIEKEELAWLLLNFNQKRGYYQLRGEDDEKTDINEYVIPLRVILIDKGNVDTKNKEKNWYTVTFENGWTYSATFLKEPNWKDSIRDFLVTEKLDESENIKVVKATGKEDRKITPLPTFEEIDLMSKKDQDKIYKKIKARTEITISNTGKTVGSYIFDTLLENPNQKIKGKLVRTIERKFYKAELEAILKEQIKHHPELQNKEIYEACSEELYEQNEGHRNSIADKGFLHLFLNDIIFYQRPLKSQKSQISDCKFEKRAYLKDNKLEFEPIKCAPKSHPLYQEFRLWQFIQNLRIYKKEDDKDVTADFLNSVEDWESLFDWLNDRKEIDQKAFLKYPFFNLKKNADLYRWNYIEDKTYPCNETRATIISRLEKANISTDILTKEIEEALWHILYSVTDKIELEKALKTFATKYLLNDEFVEIFKKYPPYKSEYGAYSIKALKKMLPLMRLGKYWSQEAINPKTAERIDKIINGEYDETIRKRVREKAYNFTDISQFSNLPVWLTSYIVYDRHSEDGELLRWKTPQDIEHYLKFVFKQHSLRNPIVEQVIAETLRVVKDIWKYYGNSQENFFDEIHIELGREMKNPADKRKKMTEGIAQNENTNLRIKAMLMEFLNDAEIENVRPYSPSQQEILKIYEEGALNAINEIPEDILKISKLAQPTNAELTKYKLWLNQKYRSPYTGEVIPLNKLFTPAYEIEHIIPQSRFFDDSFSNKVICEESVNKLKDNMLGLEFIEDKGGTKLEISGGKHVTIFTKDQYEEHVKTNFKNNRGKMKKLLMDDIPEAFVQRQLNDTRYISKVVKNLLSNIVREESEQETVSKHLLSTNGAITSALKQDWGLNDIWNDIITPRFERLNTLTNSTHFGIINPNTGKFLPQVPIELQKGFNKKRIDHRHHALDALVIACATRDHINYLNNESALGKDKKEIKETKRFDLRHKLCTKKYNEGSDKNYKWVFNSPWVGFAKDAKDQLETTVVSFKQNLRVINKTVNYYSSYRDEEGNLRLDKNGKPINDLIKQTKGENWAIRKPIHKATVSGKVDIQNLRLPNGRFATATRKELNTSFDVKTIKSITDSGIIKILLEYLKEKDENPEIAFSTEGIEELNNNIKKYNNGKAHKPIHRVRIFEISSRFSLGLDGNKNSKFVEAAQGTNLYFAIYQNENMKRSFQTIPLNVVIKRLKQNLNPAPEKDENGNNLIMYLSPNDLVYIPANDELNNINKNFFKNINKEQIKRLWNVNDFSSTIYFTPNSLAKSIASKEVDLSFDENTGKLSGSYDVKSASFEGNQIKDRCIKIKVNRLGDISLD